MSVVLCSNVHADSDLQTDLKPGSMRFAADHHLVVVSSPMSGPGKYTLNEFGADAEHFSVATGVQSAPFTGICVLVSHAVHTLSVSQFSGLL